MKHEVRVGNKSVHFSQDLFRRQEKQESRLWWEAKDFSSDDDDDLESDVVGETLFREGNGRTHLSRLDRHDTASDEDVEEVEEETGKGLRADPDIKTTRENNPRQEKEKKSQGKKDQNHNQVTRKRDTKSRGFAGNKIFDYRVESVKSWLLHWPFDLSLTGDWVWLPCFLRDFKARWSKEQNNQTNKRLEKKQDLVSVASKNIVSKPYFKDIQE